MVKFLTTESRTHRTVEVGRGLWRTSGPTPPIRQGHLEPVTQDFVTEAANTKKSLQVLHPYHLSVSSVLGKFCTTFIFIFSFFSSYFDTVAAITVILCRITKWKFCWRPTRKYFFFPQSISSTHWVLLHFSQPFCCFPNPLWHHK